MLVGLQSYRVCVASCWLVPFLQVTTTAWKILVCQPKKKRQKLLPSSEPLTMQRGKPKTSSLAMLIILLWAWLETLLQPSPWWSQGIPLASISNCDCLVDLHVVIKTPRSSNTNFWQACTAWSFAYPFRLCTRLVQIGLWGGHVGCCLAFCRQLLCIP